MFHSCYASHIHPFGPMPNVALCEWILPCLPRVSVKAGQPVGHHVCRPGLVSSWGPRAHVPGERAALRFVPGSHLPTHLHPGHHLPNFQRTRARMCPELVANKGWMHVLKTHNKSFNNKKHPAVKCMMLLYLGLFSNRCVIIAFMVWHSLWKQING